VKIMDGLRWVDRLQRATWFKVVASCVIAAAAVSIIGLDLLSHAQEPVVAVTPQGEASDGQPAQVDVSREALERILRRQSDRTGFVTGVLAVAGLSMGVVWIGLALTYVGLGAIGAAVAWPMLMSSGSRGLGGLIVGAVALTMTFTTLMQLLRMALSGAGPIAAVARNVLAEAVRLKLSVVFIVLLVVMLAALPGLLDSENQLRYRVQTFLQYGVSGPFWLLAILTTLFGVATVAFEQRDKLIWQTITKPVPVWKYIFGKWLGVASLNAVLLASCSIGVFLFTEYLRDQPASGEVRAYEASSGAITQDRLKLETEVLAARKSVFSYPEGFPDRDSDVFKQALAQYIETRRRENPAFASTPEQFSEVAESLYKSEMEYGYWILGPSPIFLPTQMPSGEVMLQPAFQYNNRIFEFRNMTGAQGSPITVMYRIQSAESNPSHFFDLLFEFESASRGPVQIRQTVAPGVSQQFVVEIGGVPITDLIVRDGMMFCRVTNFGRAESEGDDSDIGIKSDSFRLMYSEGGWRSNFFRVVVVLWAKLSVLAMLGIALATFLSFPVACLLAGAVFLIAETAGSMGEILDTYRTMDLRTREDILWRVLVRDAAVLIRAPFARYAELQPASRLVDGLRIGWGEIALSLVAMTLVWGLILLLGVFAMRKRELAMYSGS